MGRHNFDRGLKEHHQTRTFLEKGRKCFIFAPSYHKNHILSRHGKEAICKMNDFVGTDTVMLNDHYDNDSSWGGQN